MVNSLLITASENIATAEDTFSQRLMHVLHLFKISQSELARRIGVKPQIIQYLCTSDAKKSKFAYDIAFALDVSPDWLIAGKGPMRIQPPGAPLKKEYIKIPLLSWDQISAWLSAPTIENFPIDEYAFTTIDLPPNAYALKLLDAAMSPRFEAGTQLIINPNLPPQENDFVIANLGKNTLPILRQLSLKNDKLILMPFNTKLYKPIDFDSSIEILGVVRQANFEYSRNHHD